MHNRPLYVQRPARAESRPPHAPAPDTAPPSCEPFPTTLAYSRHASGVVRSCRIAVAHIRKANPQLVALTQVRSISSAITSLTNRTKEPAPQRLAEVGLDLGLRKGWCRAHCLLLRAVVEVLDAGRGGPRARDRRAPEGLALRRLERRALVACGLGAGGARSGVERVACRGHRAAMGVVASRAVAVGERCRAGAGGREQADDRHHDPVSLHDDGTSGHAGGAVTKIAQIPLKSAPGCRDRHVR